MVRSNFVFFAGQPLSHVYAFCPAYVSHVLHASTDANCDAAESHRHVRGDDLEARDCHIETIETNHDGWLLPFNKK